MDKYYIIVNFSNYDVQIILENIQCVSKYNKNNILNKSNIYLLLIFFIFKQYNKMKLFQQFIHHVFLIIKFTSI